MRTPITYPLPQPLPLRVAAKIISYIFHPLFIPLYVVSYMLFIHPYAFAILDEKQKLMKLIFYFSITVFYPAFTVFLLWRLKFSESIFLRTQKERIIPYVASITYFFWAWYVSRGQSETPITLVSFLFGLFLSASAALMGNSFFKISMHAIGVGGAATFMIILGMVSSEAMGLPITYATMIAGMVCTARLIVSDHDPMEIVWGFSAGVVCQLIACWIVM